MPQARDWSKTIALITGASRGIGRAAALQMAARGATVWACARSEGALAELAMEAEGQISWRALDVRDGRAVADWIAELEEARGRLDVLVNNASVLGPKGPIEDQDPQGWRDTIAINVHGVFEVTRHAIGLLRRGTRPVIVNISSSVGRQGRAGWGAYSVSKFGLEGLTQILADELAGDGVAVASLNPGGTATEMRAQAYPDEDPATLPQPEEVAATILELADTLTPANNQGEYSSREMMGAG